MDPHPRGDLEADPMKHVILVRHGESEHHVRGLAGGWTDLSLTQRGKAQARRVAERLAAMGIGPPTRLHTSDLRRAIQTSSEIAERTGCEMDLEPGLRELNNGKAAGLSLEEAAAIELPRSEPVADWVPYEGAESWHAMSLRVFACMERIASDTTDQLVLVGHSGSLSAVVRWWLGSSPDNSELIEFEFDPASLTELRVNKWGERSIVRLNDVSHLER